MADKIYSFACYWIFFSALAFLLFLSRKDSVEKTIALSKILCRENAVIMYLTCCLIVIYLPITIPYTIKQLIKENNGNER
jgi:hypothetical protein